ncbi:hypothetical protein HPB49_026239 [Dermacentor silvarum]|nr:hypothetical protein HPB49_026239 [Dermacentor silvarum]
MAWNIGKSTMYVIRQWNCPGFRRKRGNLQQFLQTKDSKAPDMIALQETGGPVLSFEHICSIEHGDVKWTFEALPSLSNSDHCARDNGIPGHHALCKSTFDYRDYPNSFPTKPVVCRQLSRSSKLAEPDTLLLGDLVLELVPGQPDNRVLVVFSVQTSRDRQSAAWIAVNTSLVEHLRDRDYAAILLHRQRCELRARDRYGLVVQVPRSAAADCLRRNHQKSTLKGPSRSLHLGECSCPSTTSRCSSLSRTPRQRPSTWLPGRQREAGGRASGFSRQVLLAGSGSTADMRELLDGVCGTWR